MLTIGVADELFYFLIHIFFIYLFSICAMDKNTGQNITRPIEIKSSAHRQQQQLNAITNDKW